MNNASKLKNISTANNSKLHARNKHKNGYDFTLLCKNTPELKQYVFTNQYETQTIDFTNSKAILALNYSLLITYYDITYWKIPDGFLCPPIPGRADYIHYLADLLKETNNGKIPHKKTIQALDIGTGANCIYPIIGATQYKWNFVATDINAQAIKSANSIVINNINLSPKIKLVTQLNNHHIFRDIIEQQQRIDITLCNPPFHSSANAAAEGTERKWKNLSGNASKKQVPSNQLNFGGKHNELWCDGGELQFIKNMIKESQYYSSQVLWFTCLVSKKEHIRPLQLALKKVKKCDVKVIKMKQGQKISRFIAWSFLTDEEKQEWCSDHFS